MTDPNADLIGYTFPTEKGQGTVTGTAEWAGSEYVTVRGNTWTTVRQAKQVRRHKQLVSAA